MNILRHIGAGLRTLVSLIRSGPFGRSQSTKPTIISYDEWLMETAGDADD